jgi:hypothetical protein
VSTIPRPRRAAQVAAIVFGLVALGLGLATASLDAITHEAGVGSLWTETIANAAAVTPAAAVGTLLAARRPRNPIGWMILAILVLGFSPTGEYAVLDYRMHHGALPLGGLAVILQECWPLFLVFIAIMVWVFPDGKLPGGRWRRLSTILVVAGLLIAVAASAPGVIAVAGHDVQLTADGDLTNRLPIVAKVLSGAAIVGSLASWLAWVVIQIPTYRHASGERRQQLKWLYSGAVLFLVSLAISVFIVPIASGQPAGWGTGTVINYIFTFGTGALPVCLGVAVLKYRLYDLTRIISRVVSYTVITALLGGVFVGLILLATRVLPVKGAAGVAAATLITAALFNPLRRRVQRVVDRRFNRSRYNAEAVVAAFSGRLRHTVDLDAVRCDLVGVVSEAFEPTAVSVWLTPGTEPPARPVVVGGATL